MKNLILILLANIFLLACTSPQPDTTSTPAEDLPIEFADPKFTQLAKDNMRLLAEGDIAAFSTGLADNAVFVWNNGDSIKSKQAIIDFWKERRGKAIDTITYSKEAWLSIKANNPPEHIKKGVYVFNWSQFHVTYANGNSIDQNIHTVFQFSDQDKVSTIVQYLDRAPINAATATTKK